MRVLKLLVVLAAAALALAPLPRGAVERIYARTIYPILQPPVTALANSTPFAWFDVMVLVATASLVMMWLTRLVRRRAGAAKVIAGLTLDTLAAVAVFYLWFLGSWGLNYRREPLRAQLDFQEHRITTEALRALALRNVESLNALHGAAHAAGWVELAEMRSVLAPAFVQAQQDLAMSWRVEPGRPKRSLFDFYFTRVSIDGMTDPFFLETLANQSLLPFERPATVAHEWSHLAGYADESEANFLGWLVCMRGPASVQYSGWLSLYGTVVNALPRGDRDEMIRALAPGPRQDLRAIGERIQRHIVPVASRAGYALYDRFLKANRVEAGIRSYSDVIRLLLGTSFDADGSPVLRR